MDFCGLQWLVSEVSSGELQQGRKGSSAGHSESRTDVRVEKERLLVGSYTVPFERLLVG